MRTIIAGTGLSATTDGIGTAASFKGPYGLALSSASDILYVGDPSSNAVRQLVISTGTARCSCSTDHLWLHIIVVVTLMKAEFEIFISILKWEITSGF